MTEGSDRFSKAESQLEESVALSPRLPVVAAVLARVRRLLAVPEQDGR
jgi:hypothetical protein